MISNSFDHYDATEDWITYQVFNEIAQDNFELQQWLIEEGYIYFNEAGDANQAYQQWKININTQMKNTLTKFGQFSLQQLAKDMPFLQTFKEVILNQKQYPPKDNLIMKNAPNYMAAVNRISAPITNNINSINLANVEGGKGNKVNMSVKKSIIPSYDGKTDFKQFCKNYFYGGELKRQNLNSTQCGQLLPLAFQFCSTYESRLKSLQTEIAAIANYINNESGEGGVKASTQGDLRQLQNIQQKSQTQGMASSNPTANAVGQPQQQVNASTDYTYFMKYYFSDILHEDGLPNQVNKQNTISGQKGVSPTSKPNDSQGNRSTLGAQVNTKALSIKKKQTVVNVIVDAFTSKITALGMLYHDFIYLLRAHVASYKGAVHANMGRVQNMQQQPPMNNNQQPQQQPMQKPK